MSARKRMTLLVSSWRRTCSQESSPFPTDIVQHIIEYLKIAPFEWDPNRKGQWAVLLDNNRMIEHHGNWNAVISKSMLDAAKWRSAIWELTLIEIKKGDEYLMIGFVDSTAVDEVKLNGNYSLAGSDRPKECVLNIMGDSFSKKSGGITNQFDAKWKGSNCRNGDRVRLEFDFAAKKCTAYYNDNVVGDISESLPNQIHLAFTSPCDMKVATTKFEAVV